MTVAAMNHFTVLSDDLEATRRFYCDLFGFKVGWRPPFQFPGWWLYADDADPARDPSRSAARGARRCARPHGVQRQGSAGNDRDPEARRDRVRAAPPSVSRKDGSWGSKRSTGLPIT